MLKMITTNMPTFIVCVILLIAVVFAIKGIIAKRQKGCEMGCSGCTGSCNAFHCTKEAIRKHNGQRKA